MCWCLLAMYNLQKNTINIKNVISLFNNIAIRFSAELYLYYKGVVCMASA